MAMQNTSYEEEIAGQQRAHKARNWCFAALTATLLSIPSAGPIIKFVDNGGPERVMNGLTSEFSKLANLIR